MTQKQLDDFYLKAIDGNYRFNLTSGSIAGLDFRGKDLNRFTFRIFDAYHVIAKQIDIDLFGLTDKSPGCSIEYNFYITCKGIDEAIFHEDPEVNQTIVKMLLEQDGTI